MNRHNEPGYLPGDGNRLWLGIALTVGGSAACWVLLLVWVMA